MGTISFAINVTTFSVQQNQTEENTVKCFFRGTAKNLDFSMQWSEMARVKLTKRAFFYGAQFVFSDAKKIVIRQTDEKCEKNKYQSFMFDRKPNLLLSFFLFSCFLSFYCACNGQSLRFMKKNTNWKSIFVPRQLSAGKVCLFSPSAFFQNKKSRYLVRALLPHQNGLRHI